MIKKILTWGGVAVGALIITALGIDAADTLQGNSGTLLSNVISVESSVCPEGMTELTNVLTATCIDMYEASAGENCPHRAPLNAIESGVNVEDVSCDAVSTQGERPWTNLTREQAETACARSGKRLPTNEEWYFASLGTPDANSANGCNTEGEDIVETGERESCVSALGAHDMIGNVWEWVRGDVFDGVYEGRPLPESGFIVQVDSSGVAIDAENTPNELFNNDYVWTNSEGTFGMMRGGFYRSREDGGVYALNAFVLPTTGGTAIGFRCVQ